MAARSEEKRIGDKFNLEALTVNLYSRSAKGGEKGNPNSNPWLAKMLYIGFAALTVIL